jgi:hypothetical protein
MTASTPRVATESTLTRQFLAWEGTVDDLRRVVAAVDAGATSVRDSAVKEFDAGVAARLAAARERAERWNPGKTARERAAVDSAVDREQQSIDRERAELAGRFEVIVRANEGAGGVSTRGPADQVLQSLDVKAQKELDVESSLWLNRERVYVRFRPKEVAVEVTGPPEWARGVFANVVDAVKRGEPRWSVMRTRRAYLAWAALIYVALMAWFVPAALASEKVSVSTAALISVQFAVTALLLGGGVAQFVRNRLPGFQLVRPGEEGAGRRVVALLVALAVSFVASLVAGFYLR